VAPASAKDEASGLVAPHDRIRVLGGAELASALATTE
jgi:hypothetical protein